MNLKKLRHKSQYDDLISALFENSITDDEDYLREIQDAIQFHLELSSQHEI